MDMLFHDIFLAEVLVIHPDAVTNDTTSPYCRPFTTNIKIKSHNFV